MTDKPIPTPGYRLDEARVRGGFAQRRAQTCNSDIQAIVKVNEHVLAPKPLPQLITRDELSGMLQQRGKHLKGLVAKSDPNSTLAKFAEREIGLEAIEADNVGQYPVPSLLQSSAYSGQKCLSIVCFQQDAWKGKLQGEYRPGLFTCASCPFRIPSSGAVS